MANMWDLTGTYVAHNYRRVQPSSQFGTRILRFVGVYVPSANFTTNQGDSDSNFSKAVIAMQNYGESWVVGAPTSDTFTMVFSSDTAQDANVGTNEIGGWGQAADAVAAALDLGGVEVYDMTLLGDGFDY